MLAVFALIAALSPVEIDEVLQRARPELQACTRDDFVGTLVLDITINDAGVVSGVVPAGRHTLRGEHGRRLQHNEAVECLLARLAWLRFDSTSTHDTKVRVRFDLNPHDLTIHTSTSLRTSREPTVELDEQGLPVEVVAAAAAQMPALLDCYRQALLANAQAEGTLTVQHVVEDGVVVDDALLPTMSGDIAHVPLLAACVRNVLRDVDYPAAASSTMSLRLSFRRTLSLADIEDAVARVYKPLRACGFQRDVVLKATFYVDAVGRASDVVVLQRVADNNIIDVDCVSAAVVAGVWPAGPAHVGATLLDDAHLPDMHEVFAAQVDDLMACYGGGLSRNSRLAGTLTLTFEIDTNGFVINIRPTHPGPGVVEIAEPGMVACVTDVFRRSRFRPPENGVLKVIYPLTFKR